MYFVQYLHEIVGDYSVCEDLGTVTLNNIDGKMEEIIQKVSEKTKHTVLSIRNIVPLNQ